MLTDGRQLGSHLVVVERLDNPQQIASRALDEGGRFLAVRYLELVRPFLEALNRDAFLDLYNFIIERLWLLVIECEQLWTRLVADFDQVAKALGDNKCVFCAFPLKQG